jgi:hypothetical protein
VGRDSSQLDPCIGRILISWRFSPVRGPSPRPSPAGRGSATGDYNCSIRIAASEGQTIPDARYTRANPRSARISTIAITRQKQPQACQRTERRHNYTVNGPIAQRLEQATHNRKRPFPHRAISSGLKRSHADRQRVKRGSRITAKETQGNPITLKNRRRVSDCGIRF